MLKRINHKDQKQLTKHNQMESLKIVGPMKPHKTRNQMYLVTWRARIMGCSSLTREFH